MPSPKPKKIHTATVNDKLSFFEALKVVSNGGKVTKLEWNNELFYGILQDAILKLHKADGNFYPWIISEGDLIGKDYYSIK